MTTFLVRFGICYGLLIVPWPGWNAAYSRFFRTLGEAAFGADGSQRVVRFEAAHDMRPPLDSEILVANRGRIGPTGRALGKRLGLDTRGIGWIPTALVIALVLAKLMPVRRLIVALGAGLVLVHIFIFASVDCYILNESTDLGLFTVGPFGKAVLAGLEETLVTQMGASFVVPVIIWLLVAFRVDEFRKLVSHTGLGWVSGGRRSSVGGR